MVFVVFTPDKWDKDAVTAADTGGERDGGGVVNRMAPALKLRNVEHQVRIRLVRRGAVAWLSYPAQSAQRSSAQFSSAQF